VEKGRQSGELVLHAVEMVAFYDDWTEHLELTVDAHNPG